MLYDINIISLHHHHRIVHKSFKIKNNNNNIKTLKEITNKSTKGITRQYYREVPIKNCVNILNNQPLNLYSVDTLA